MPTTRTVSLESLGVIVTEDIKRAFDDIAVNAGILQESLYKNGSSLQQVAGELEQRYGWIEHPLDSEQNNDLRRAVDIVVKGLSTGHFTEQQFLNAIIATFKNPINRREYGDNSPATIARKGFNKVMVDTGKFISSIKASLTRSE